MAVRLKDIARDLGVSVITVSKVLRNHHDIGVETRERVLRRVKELNYEPNPTARALVTGRTHMIGLVVPDLVHPFFAQVAKGVSRGLRSQGYGLVISSSEEDPSLEKQEINQLLGRNLDALIIASVQWTVESFRRIEERQRPYVLIDRKFAGLAANFVGADDLKVGTMGTEHLIEIGCRRIGYIGGQLISTATERLMGYRHALALHGQPMIQEYVVCRSQVDDAADETGFRAMNDLLRLDTPPDGVFCYNDPLAMGAMKAVLEAGLRVPEDIAIVGAGNVRYASNLQVPLTSIDTQSETIGERAAAMALGLISSKAAEPPQQVLMPLTLVRRQSTMRPLV